MVLHFFTSVLIVVLVGTVVCPPPRRPPQANVGGGANNDLNEKKSGESPDPMEDIAKLEYDRYLKEVVNTLETDDMFRKKLEDASADEIKTGDIAQHLEFVSYGVRSKLDELKRQEMGRVRQLLRMRMQQAQNLGKGGLLGPAASIAAGMKLIEDQKMMAHLDHSNAESFGVDDLSKLIKQASKDLDDIDKKRREEFKTYEMQREHQRREKMKQMDDRKRAEEQAAWEEKKRNSKNHPKVNHPGGRDQLEEVWEKNDGYDKEDFNPKTFFFLHDTNGNGVLEHDEIESLFLKELEKLFKDDDSQESKMKRFEEMNRMREHVVKEVDKDKDGLISLDEFLSSTKEEAFENSEEDWDDLDDEDLYTSDEMDEYDKEYEDLQREEAFEGHAQPGEVNIPHQVDRGQMPGVNGVQHMGMPQEVQDQRRKEEIMRQAEQQAREAPQQANQLPVQQQGQPEQEQGQGQGQAAQQHGQGQQVQQQGEGQPIQQQDQGQPIQQQDQGRPLQQQDQGQPIQQQGQGQPIQQQGQPQEQQPQA